MRTKQTVATAARGVSGGENLSGNGLRLVAWAFVLVVMFVFAAPVQARTRPDDVRPRVQLAILLDTSNSMDGLIAQAKTELWTIVNKLAKAKRKGLRPRLEVALYEYGNSGLSRGGGYIRQVLPLTTDLDDVSEKLFGLRTNGGDEFCGQVIDVATHDLSWSKSRGSLKLIYIAGNEPFTQGSVDYRDAVKGAINDGIIVNTIHCGTYAEGVSGKWKDAARLADGSYLHIDQDRAIVQIQAPQDDEISRLNQELNSTFVGYGRRGKAKKARQMKQDSNAASLGSATAAQRASFKASSSYSTADWDLVSAAAEGKVDIAEVEEEALPEQMKEMSKDERRDYVKGQDSKRKELREKIQELSKERAAFVAKKRREESSKETTTFGEAVMKSIETQAAKEDYTFDK